MGRSDTMVKRERGNSMSCTSCIIPVLLIILVVSIVQPGMVQLKAFPNTQMLFTIGAPGHNLLLLELLSPRTSFFVSTNNTSPSHFSVVKEVLPNQTLLTRRWPGPSREPRSGLVKEWTSFSRNWRFVRFWYQCWHISPVNDSSIDNSNIVQPPKYFPPPFNVFSSNTVVTEMLTSQIDPSHELIVVSNNFWAAYIDPWPTRFSSSFHYRVSSLPMKVDEAYTSFLSCHLTAAMSSQK